MTTVKTLMIAVLAALLLEPCPARERRQPAAVALNRSKDGEETYFIFGTGATGKLEELPAELKKTGYREVDISVWNNKTDCRKLIDQLKKQGLRIPRCYVPEPGKPSWFRKNIAGPEPVDPGKEKLEYTRALIANNAYNRRYKLPGKFRAVKYVTIHNTAEPFSARQERDRVDFRRDKASVSFHFAVDECEVVQILPLDVHGWHAGDGASGPGNAESIGVEICRSQCRGPADWQYRRSEANAEILASALLRHFDLTEKDLFMHQDWSGKYCPHRILEEKRFESFRARVGKRLARKPDAEEQLILRGLKARS